MLPYLIGGLLSTSSVLSSPFPGVTQPDNLTLDADHALTRNPRIFVGPGMPADFDYISSWGLAKLDKTTALVTILECMVRVAKSDFPEVLIRDGHELLCESQGLAEGVAVKLAPSKGHDLTTDWALAGLISLLLETAIINPRPFTTYQDWHIYIRDKSHHEIANIDLIKAPAPRETAEETGLLWRKNDTFQFTGDTLSEQIFLVSEKAISLVEIVIPSCAAILAAASLGRHRMAHDVHRIQTSNPKSFIHLRPFADRKRLRPPYISYGELIQGVSDSVRKYVLGGHRTEFRSLISLNEIPMYEAYWEHSY